ncbi:hypothetical protein HYPSUDRAFT_210279 [Hypholoma sublateritium FD-334 SS-4]|uniref:Uncharacterized protein n=1 Tax=Hypholoma sublateritium (strain FD-334 SS-4) TaxID=945553 RepID=A0A0D2NVT9_HYPSF|nr:hypothetical protein HYPSUDRAFT_210279 [Hypholoma sublateritium FD-334 SS-4]
MSIIEGMQAPGRCFNCTLVFQKAPFGSCICEFNGWGMPCTRCRSHGRPVCTFALPIPGLVDTIASLQGWCQVQPNLLPEILDDVQQAGLEALHLQNLALAKGCRAALLMQRACSRTKGIDGHNAMFRELLLADANLPSSSSVPLPQQEIRVRTLPPCPIPSWAIPSTSTAPPPVLQPTTRTVSVIRADASGEFSLHPATFPSWGSKRAPASTASREPPRISRRDSVFLEAPPVVSTTEDSPVVIVDARQFPAPVVNLAPSKDTAHDGDVSMGDTILVDNSTYAASFMYDTWAVAQVVPCIHRGNCPRAWAVAQEQFPAPSTYTGPSDGLIFWAVAQHVFRHQLACS